MDDLEIDQENKHDCLFRQGKEISSFLSDNLSYLDRKRKYNIELLDNLRAELDSNELKLSDLKKHSGENSKGNSLLESNINELEARSDELRGKIEEIVKEANNQLYSINKFRDVSQYIDYIIHECEGMESKEKIINESINGLKILEVQENERQRIARDLHDSTVQNLTSIIHKTELCIKLLDIDIIRAKLELSTISSTIRSIINEMRDIIYDLKPMSLTDLGFIVTIKQAAKQIMASHDIKVKVISNDEPKDIMPVIKLTLFRLIQEACNNIVKHAKAHVVEIKVNFKEDEIEISITDDGIGIELEKQEKRKQNQYSGFGISIMKERIYLLSGTLKIQSERKKGTNITINVPLNKYKGDTYEQSN